MTDKRLDIFWKGPFEWPEPRQASPLNGLDGVYIWTVEGNSGRVVIGCGHSTGIHQRFVAHRREFLRGAYAILDLESARLGIRKELWPGFWAPYNTEEQKAKYLARKDDLVAAATTQLAATRIFIAEIADGRLKERMEAGIVRANHVSQKPFLATGMSLRPRRNEELAITVNFKSIHEFCNLPPTFEI